MNSTHLTSVTRSLAVNVYQLWDKSNDLSLPEWFENLENQHSADKLSTFVRQLGESVGAKILNLSTTSYEPFGASAALLVGQELSQLAHLDASHIAVHSYFDSSEEFGQFRLEVEISTCGVPKPIKLIADVVRHCIADFVQVDFRTRGISWSEQGLPVLANEIMAKEDIDQMLLDVSDYQLIHSSSLSERSLYLELVRSELGQNKKDLITSMLKRAS
ncbi:MAG: S-adenosylmethionine/arginine decarboxylase-like enzyme [Candidatus Azotimanducaceae bacterium]|jgi:S-adenosylmethionine/arginine decarboxylase-like enzyme